MNISMEDIKKTEKISYIRLNCKERNELAEDMKFLVKGMERLKDTAVNITCGQVEAESLREDKVSESTDKTKILSNAPETDGTYIIVPKTVE